MIKPKRPRTTGRKEGWTFVAIPHPVMDSDNWRQCSGTAIKMLCDLARQYRGTNNGDLCAAATILKRYGWTADETIHFALKELRHYGFIILTRQGGLHQASLYALTWHGIDPCGGKVTEATPEKRALHLWKEPKPEFRRPPKKRKPTTPAEFLATPSVAKRLKLPNPNYAKRT